MKKHNLNDPDAIAAAEFSSLVEQKVEELAQWIVDNEIKGFEIPASQLAKGLAVEIESRRPPAFNPLMFND